MLILNLPSFAHKISQNEGDLYIYDPFRKAKLKLTPEEWVRQHFLNYLVHHLHYPKGLIHSEIGLQYHKRAKRADIIVYSPDNGEPLILIECKAPFIKISSRTLQQASVYFSQLKPKYIVLTNGMQHHYYKIENEVLQIHELPSYNQVV